MLDRLQDEICLACTFYAMNESAFDITCLSYVFPTAGYRLIASSS